MKTQDVTLGRMHLHTTVNSFAQKSDIIVIDTTIV